MSNALEIVVEILTELKVISSTPNIGGSDKTFPEFPSFISAGDDASLIINGKISQLIRSLSNCLYPNKPELLKSISSKDWSSNVQRSLGPILATVELDHSFVVTSAEILSALESDLRSADWNFEPRTFLFGCSLINQHDISPFVVGPVTIWGRNQWTDHALEQGLIDRVTQRRLKARWSGQKVSRRAASAKSRNEEDILDSVTDAPFVCTVRTEGLFGDFAKEKALLAARITLLGVGLLWNKPTRALSEMNLSYDGPAYRQTYAFFQHQNRLSYGSRWMKSVHGMTLFDEAWETLIEKRADWWKILGEVVEFLLCVDGSVTRPKLISRFAHALIWLHEACREPLPMIAITKFMSSLDALAGGKKGPGIVGLVSARFGVDPETSIRRGGPSFKSAINELYSQGRSRLLHGSSDRLGHDWENQRALAESLARHCMVLCFHWAAENPNCDDPQRMASDVERTD